MIDKLKLRRGEEKSDGRSEAKPSRTRAIALTVAVVQHGSVDNKHLLRV